MATDTERPGVGAALPDWLPALAQLASPTLPIGSFSYSQGLEAAAHAGLVHDEHSAGEWIESHWRQAFSPRELPVLDATVRLLVESREAGHRDVAEPGLVSRLAELDRGFLASRDSAEARAETRQTGAALLRWLATVLPRSTERAIGDRVRTENGELTAPVAFGLCAHAQGLPAAAACFAWGFAWLENQVQAAVKIVPLGQTSGQRLLIRLRGQALEPVATRAWSFSPLAAVMSMRHERQYSRLFRS